MKTIKNYSDAINYLGTKSERPYANNTRVAKADFENIKITYHGNWIVTLYPDDSISLFACGWKTITTKERLNWFLPDGFSVYQEKSVWYLSDRQAQKRYIFADGITISNDRQVTGFIPESDDTTKQTIKAIKRFVNGYVAELLAGKMDKPSGGDCWYCAMVTDDGQNLGDATKNNEHILNHFEESYYVPSLLYNAFKNNGRLCEIAKDGIARLTDESYRDSVSTWQKSVVERDVKSCLTAYLKHVLNVAQ